MMETNERKKYKELLMHRVFLAIISSIVVQFFLINCLLLIMNANRDYTLWIHGTWATITSFRTWNYFMILAIVMLLQGIMCSKTYLATPPYMKSRFMKICGAFTSQNMLLLILYVIVGGFSVWLHLSLKDGLYTSLTRNCNVAYESCLVEEHYFLLLNGLWSGVYFFVKTHVFHVKYFKFPVIPLSKFSRFKWGLYSMFPSLMVTSVWPTLHYLVGYFFLGSYLRSAALLLTSTLLETKPLDSLSRILSLSLIFHVWLYQLIFSLTINSMYLLFEVYLTEWVQFDFKQTNLFNTESNKMTLPEALSMDKIPIVQHLGYLDLMTIAQKDKHRRKILFTLSQPGGHPYNWNSIVEKCICHLRQFIEQITTVPSKSQEQQLPVTSNIILQNTTNIQKDCVYHMRSLVTKPIVQPTTVETIDTKDPLKLQIITTLQKFINAKWDAFIAYLLSKPAIHYVFGEQDASNVSHALFNGQSTIWAAEAISSLAAFSLHEDSYGIVQKDLPQIISTLMSLKQALDKLQKSNILAKKQLSDDEFVKQMFISLRAAIKRSIYRIVVNFEEYITDVGLEPSTLEPLQNFINCKE